MQRRILETLERIEEDFPGAWVLRSGLVTPKEGYEVERSDRSSTGRAVSGLARRGLVEVRWVTYGGQDGPGGQSVVRLIKEGRPPLLSPAEDLKVRMKLEPPLFPINAELRGQGTRFRVALVDVEDVERVTVFDMQTEKSYQAVHLF